MTAPAHAVRRPYEAPAVAEDNARLRERLDTYEPGDPTAASTSPRAAAPGAGGNHPAVAEDNARLRERPEAYESAEPTPVRRGGNSR